MTGKRMKVKCSFNDIKSLLGLQVLRLRGQQFDVNIIFYIIVIYPQNSFLTSSLANNSFPVPFCTTLFQFSKYIALLCNSNATLSIWFQLVTQLFLGHCHFDNIKYFFDKNRR